MTVGLPALDPFGVDRREVPTGLRIKGRAPRLAHSFTFAEVYASASARPWAAAVRSLEYEFVRFRAATRQPDLIVDPHLLRDTLLCPVSGLAVPGGPTPSIVSSPKTVALQLAQAPREKLLHTFGWIDTNLKLRTEDLCTASGLPDIVAREGAELAAKTYAALLRSDDHVLARCITFNESVFLQERVVDVLFGVYAQAFEMIHTARANRLNDAAQEVARDWRGQSLPDLLALAVVSGGAIAGLIRDGEVTDERSQDDLGRQFRTTLDRCLTDVEQLRLVQFDKFTNRLAGEPGTVGWVFDDNGESVFDLQFLDRVLEQTSVNLTLICNALPVSENITSVQLRQRIELGSFHQLAKSMRENRVRIVEEFQYLAGLEPTWLRRTTRAAFDSMDFVLLKGANIYESFQDPTIDAYYGFVVSGPNSARLTLHGPDEPVLIHSPYGHICH